MKNDMLAIWGSFLIVIGATIIMVTKATGIWWLEFIIVVLGYYIATVILRYWRNISVFERELEIKEEFEELLRKAKEK